MPYESYKVWLDEMPIDDVRRRIERLERKLADLHVLERLHEERHGDGAPEEHAEEHGSGDEEPSPESVGEEHVEQHVEDHEHS